MIAEYLDRDYVLAATRGQRDWLVALQNKIKHKDKGALAVLKKHQVTGKQIDHVVRLLTAALVKAEKDTAHPQGTAFIPSNPVTCGFQAGMTQLAVATKKVEDNAKAGTKVSPAEAAKVEGTKKSIMAQAKGPAARRLAAVQKAASGPVVDTSAPLKLKPVSEKAPKAGVAAAKAPFVENEDPLYGLDGFKAKFGALFKARRPFNKNPAKVAKSSQPLSLYMFGDWGTGLPLAGMVTNSIAKQIASADGTRQHHVVHLGDVYYVGEPEEYKKRVLAGALWPVATAQKKKVGSWSLNGNHDMYSGGHGYFDTLLAEARFIQWHGDASGKPSSFFLIEDDHWQIFGLDTSWNLPSLGQVLFGDPTIGDYGGQNGILTKEQVKWMAAVRNPAKGCVLMTHHQPASSRTTEKQHADEAVKLLTKAGVYHQIDAWFWGHEHRAVVFHPRAQRTVAGGLKNAPEFCVCLGHGGVPVTAANFENEQRKVADIVWQEDRLDETAPIYDNRRVIPFGFGRLDTLPGAFEFRVFDHFGNQRYSTTFIRSLAAAAPAAAAKGRLALRGQAVKKTARAKGKKATKAPAKPTRRKSPAKK